jgi:NAD(P)-dependent dehydrogenase (short-subunit alcohol dehydrogenase family)
MHRWHERLAPQGVSVSAMHPGWADTGGVQRSLPRFRRLTRRILRDAEQGADTAVWLAASPEAAAAGGGFWLDRVRRREHAPLRRTRSTPAEVDALWALLDRVVTPRG